MDRALIIKGEWLEKILSGQKTWEMRSTQTTIRGKIGLIEKGTGLIVGECFLEDVAKPIRCHRDAQKTERFHRSGRANYHLLKKWKYPWVISKAKKYKSPRPYSHPSGAVIWVKLK